LFRLSFFASIFGRAAGQTGFSSPRIPRVSSRFEHGKKREILFVFLPCSQAHHFFLDFCSIYSKIIFFFFYARLLCYMWKITKRKKNNQAKIASPTDFAWTKLNFLAVPHHIKHLRFYVQKKFLILMYRNIKKSRFIRFSHSKCFF